MAVWQGALREIYEETGLRPTRFYTTDALEDQNFVMQNPSDRFAIKGT